MLATRSDTTPGGGFNVMVAATRQGLPVVYAAPTAPAPSGTGPGPPCSAPGSRFRSGRGPVSTPASSSAWSTPRASAPS
ncbi:hypothetical protein ACFQX6_26290 [Streptosporangium lutulentum]